MQLLVTDEWATNEEIYSAFLHNARSQPEDGERLVVTSFGYVRMTLPGLEGVKEAWAGTCKFNGKFDHVEKRLVRVVVETQPKEVEMMLTQSPCADCSDCLLDLVMSTQIPLKLYFSSVYQHNRSREARALARLAKHPLVHIGNWGREQWNFLIKKLDMIPTKILEDPERDHWDGEWATAIREIMTDEITADPVSGERTNFYTPRPYKGNDGLLNAMDRMAFS